MSDIFRSADYARETLKKEQEAKEQTEKKIEKTDDQSTSADDVNNITEDDVDNLLEELNNMVYDYGEYVWNGPFGFYINYYE